METDFRAFFLLVETIIEIRRNSIFKKHNCQRSLFVVGETDFPAGGNHFFLSFTEHLVSFFCLLEKYFSKLSFVPAGGNGFSDQRKPFLFAQSFSSVETVTKINASLFLKKYHILTNENWFLGQWKPFSSIFLDSSQLLPVEAVFHLSRIYWISRNEVFTCFVCYFILSCFLQVETITEIRGKPILKDETYSCQRKPIFSIFFRYFLKWKQLFHKVETYFSISFVQLVQMIFHPIGNSIFWSVLFPCQQKSLLE